MTKPTLKEAWRSLDDGVQRAGPSRELDERVRAAVLGERRRGEHVRGEHRVRWIAVGGAVAVAAAIVLWFVLPRDGESPRTLGGLAVVSAGEHFKARVTPDRTVVVDTGAATLRDDVQRLTIDVTEGAGVRREAEALRVTRGRVVIRADHRSQPTPARVQVSHGVIEIMGTQFTIEQHATDGSVTLHEGAIRFRPHHGNAIDVAVGQTLTWPVDLAAQTPPVVGQPTDVVADAGVAAVPAPSDRPSKQPGKPQPRSADDAGELLKRVAELRARGEFDKAAKLLQAAIGKERDASVREQLSFELGAILTRQLHATTRACSHWKAFLARYPRGRYVDEATRLRDSLDCNRSR